MIYQKQKIFYSFPYVNANSENTNVAKPSNTNSMYIVYIKKKLSIVILHC